MTGNALFPGAASLRAAHFTLRKVNRAIREFDMIRAGDRVAVALSGGKDSLALLSLLEGRRSSSPVPYHLAAVHVRLDASGVTPPHGPLLEWLGRQEFPYQVVEPELSPGDTLPLDCQRCTWLRKKALFFAAQALGCNVVAYAHHADDVAQTTLLNLLYGGSVGTLAPVAEYFGGALRLIRPLIYVPEGELARLARVSGFPAPPPACPRASQSARRRIAGILRALGRDYADQARSNLIRAGLRGNARREG